MGKQGTGQGRNQASRQALSALWMLVPCFFMASLLQQDV